MTAQKHHAAPGILRSLGTVVVPKIFALCLLGCGLHFPSQAAFPGSCTLYVAPHSHMDMVWTWTYDKTRVVAIDILKHALDMPLANRKIEFDCNPFEFVNLGLDPAE